MRDALAQDDAPPYLIHLAHRVFDKAFDLLSAQVIDCAGGTGLPDFGFAFSFALGCLLQGELVQCLSGLVHDALGCRQVALVGLLDDCLAFGLLCRVLGA